MDGQRPDNRYGGDDGQMRGEYGYQQQPPYNSWQHSQPQDYASPPPPNAYGEGRQYYGDQRPGYGQEDGGGSYGGESRGEDYTGYPPQSYPPQPYGYEGTGGYYQHQNSGGQYPPLQPAYGYNHDDQYPPPHQQIQPPYGYDQNDSYPPPHQQTPQITQDQQRQQQPEQQPHPGNPDEERGVMGALAGGAAGAYGGHKLGHHGFLGGLAGAYMGHKLEEKHKEKKHSHSRRSSSSSSSSDDNHHHGKPVAHHAGHQSAPAGNFSSSSRQISLDKDYDLIAECRSVDGSHKLSSISLNNALTNDNGQFRWMQGGNFGASARQVRLTDGGKFLEAELCDRDGHWRHSRIWLDEKIGNDNGNLELV